MLFKHNSCPGREILSMSFWVLTPLQNNKNRLAGGDKAI